jgi:4-hydroxy-4-methyl-2-oxoglutarate aldolase
MDLSVELGNFATPTLFEASPQVAALSGAISPLFRPIRLCGPAYTVATVTGDNSAIHWAVAEAQPGTVLVVATGQDTSRGYWGEVLMEAALARGIRGLVIDGGVRDTRAMRERGFPVFSAATAIPGTEKNRPRPLKQPVTIMQVLIRPGDFVVGDDDGVVIIPSETTTLVLQAAKATVKKEIEIIEKLNQGELTVDLINLRSR